MKLLAAILIATISGCSTTATAPAAQASDSVAAVHPKSGLPVIPLTVTSGGKAHRFSVEVAATPQQQAQGLMFRTELGPDEGMIFPYDGLRAQSFWMKNTPLPLDIIYVGPDNRISNIVHGEPYSLDPLYSVGPVLGVLELNEGRAAALGIKPGDMVRW